jgi:hypothetical protein
MQTNKIYMPMYNISRIGVINFLNINQLKLITNFENCCQLLGSQKSKIRISPLQF